MRSGLFHVRQSSSVISFAFVCFLVRTDTAFPGELSLVCDSLRLRSVDVAAKDKGPMLLPGVGITFSALPFVEVAFTILGVAFAALEVQIGYAVLPVVRAVIGRDERGILPGTMVGSENPDAATNKLGVTEVATFVTIFSVGPCAYVCVVLVLPSCAFRVLLVSIPLSSDEISSERTCS